MDGVVIDCDCSDCSRQIQRCLLLGRKAMTNLNSVLKSRDITFPTKVHIVKAIVFPVVMYRCESWTIKNAECWRIDVFELGCWTRPLRVPWTARSNQSILKEINPEHSLERLMMKLPYFGHLIVSNDYWKRPWCWERLRAGGEGGDRGWDGWMASVTQWSKLWEMVKDRKIWQAAVHGVTKSRTQQWLNNNNNNNNKESVTWFYCLKSC